MHIRIPALFLEMQIANRSNSLLTLFINTSQIATEFEPAGSTLQQQPPTGQGTQGGTQIPSDPILARLVTTWATLSDERKKIICSLVGWQQDV